MNSGHHDFEYIPGFVLFNGGPGLFITNRKQTVALIKDLVVIARTKNVHLVWITHPPFPFEYSLDKHAGTTSSWRRPTNGCCP